MTDRRASPLRRTHAVVALVLALAAGGALLAVSAADRGRRPVSPAASTAAQAWPQAELPEALPDGAVFFPEVFLDAHTAVGTAPSPDGRFERLLLRSGDAALRELRRLPLKGAPSFDTFTVGGDELAWTESTGGGLSLWAVHLRNGSPARRLTTDIGDALFYGSQHDMVIADGLITWAAASAAEIPATEIRSVALTGGPVTKRDEPGLWQLTTWPWLVDGVVGQGGATRLRNMVTRQDVTVAATGAERATCTPAWCRVLVLNGDGLARIDLMRPDGADRRRTAGGLATAAVDDVALLNRFEVLSEGGPEADPDAPVPLFVYDIATGRTVHLSPDASGVAHHGGVLWWATGTAALTWHSLDLRTAVAGVGQ